MTVAERGNEAIEKLKFNSFDVALIDLALPDMEGTELFPLIEKNAPKTLKIMLTGKTHLQNCVKGADVFLGKPVNPLELLGVIDTKLKERNLDS